MKLKLGIKVGLVAVLVAGTGTAAYAAYETGFVDTLLNKDGVEVINFVGKDKRIADIWAKNNGVSEALKYEYEYSEEYNENIVIAQSYGVGRKVSNSSNLKLTVSKGYDPDKEFEFPDFTDKKKEDIEAWVEENHFTSVTYTYEAVEDISKEEDSFISASVESGAKVKRSDSIEIKLVTKDIVVPDLINMSKEDIQAWGDKWSVTISFVEQEDSMREEGTIISVSAENNSKIKAGDTITVTVAKKKSEDEQTEEEASWQTGGNKNDDGETRENSSSNNSSVNNSDGNSSNSQTSDSSDTGSVTYACPVELPSDFYYFYDSTYNSVIQSALSTSYPGCSISADNNNSSGSMKLNGWYANGNSATFYTIENQ